MHLYKSRQYAERAPVGSNALAIYANMCSVSIKGRPITWLDTAIDRGDAAGAISAALEMERGTLSLDHSLAVLVLMADAGDPGRYDRAAARWIERWMLERAAPLAAGDRDRWRELLDGLPSLEAVTSLAIVCERLHLEHAARALVHLYPRVR